jgi:hypothetical protein
MTLPYGRLENAAIVNNPALAAPHTAEANSHCSKLSVGRVASPPLAISPFNTPHPIITL